MGRSDKRLSKEEVQQAARKRAAAWVQANPERHLANKRKWYAVPANRDKSRRAQRKYALWQYGVTIEDFDRMLLFQGGSCGICKTETPGGMGAFHVDHRHVEEWDALPPESRRLLVRGLLCWSCNKKLGQYETIEADSSWVEAALLYRARGSGL